MKVFKRAKHFFLMILFHRTYRLAIVDCKATLSNDFLVNKSGLLGMFFQRTLRPTTNDFQVKNIPNDFQAKNFIDF